MNYRTFFQSLSYKTMYAAYLQLAISYVYIPILIYWGIPISLMSIVGNLLFAPWLVVFLFVSTILFVTELAHIPNFWLAQLLDTLSSWWLTLLAMGSPTWLIGFPYPGTLALSCIIATGVVIMYLTRHQSIAMQSLVLFIALCLWLIGIKCYTPLSPSISIAYHNATATAQRVNRTITLRLPRTTIYPTSFVRWYKTTAQQACYRAFGNFNVSALIAVNPTQHAVTVLQELKDKLGYQQLIVIK